MIQFMIRKWIPNFEQTDNRNVREKYITLSGIIGIICNLLVFVLKLTIGLLVNSIAIISDAFNNMTDIGSSVIAIFSAKLSNRPPDREHPHGHGRAEYIGSLVVAFIIFTVGIELLRRSYDRFLNPEPLQLSMPLLGILAFSVLVKLWMFSYNWYIAKKIHSSMNRANAYDSLSDSFATGIIIVSMAAGMGMNFPIDGLLGLLMSMLIMYSGFDVARDTVNLLLGSAPEQDLIEQIDQAVRSGGLVLDTHDLEIHDYGPGRVSASIHAVVPDTAGIVETHTIIDALEKKIAEDTGVHMIIHMDPVSTDEDKVRKVRADVDSCLDPNCCDYRVQRFRIAQGHLKVIVMFDLVFSADISEEECLRLESEIRMRIEEAFNHYHVAIDRITDSAKQDSRDLLKDQMTE